MDKLSLETYASEDGPRVTRIVLTGGPCAGKTTGMARLSIFLTERGFSVFTVPEAATICWSNGAVQFDETTTEQQKFNFQAALMQMAMSLEDTFFKIAKNGKKPAVLLCDRGLMDGSAYITEELWNNVLQKFGYNNVMLRDERYDLIFYLVTAADGAESHYTLENNLTRTEGLAAAKELDTKLQQAWIGHPHLHIFDNSTDFEGKMRRIVNAASHALGLPTTKRSARKFLLKGPPDWSGLDIKHETFDVTKVYLRGSTIRADSKRSSTVDLRPDGTEKLEASERVLYSFVRRRTSGNKSSYNKTTMIELNEVIDGKMKTRTFERKLIMTSRQYNDSIVMADPDRNQLLQKRTSFLHEGSYLTIVEYMNVKPGLCILRVQESKDDEDEFNMPSFLDVEKEVYNAKEYSAYYLSVLGHR